MKKGELMGENLGAIIFWIIFFSLALGVVYFVFRRFTG